MPEWGCAKGLIILSTGILIPADFVDRLAVEVFMMNRGVSISKSGERPYIGGRKIRLRRLKRILRQSPPDRLLQCATCFRQ